jgi:hypothetical protein
MTAMTDERPFRMTVDLNVLDHLADGLYSSVAAVITETVANAWDADATVVDITMDLEHDRIVVLDNGTGMDTQAVNDHYLRVAYRRRDEGDATSRGRLVMGRKGIGKLSLFSVAHVIEIHTKTMGRPAIGLRVVAGELRSAMESRSAAYYPGPVTATDDSFPEGQGTRVTVSCLKRERLREMAPDSLRRRLARRFSIIGSDEFRVLVNGIAVTSADREDLKFVEYLWSFGSTQLDTSVCAALRTHDTLPDRAAGWDTGWRVRGWIGTVDRPKRLATPEGNLNSIVLLSRGRLVDEDVLGRVSGAEVYTKYLTGQVDADFLDATKATDIVTSNRQRVIEDDARVVALLAYVKTCLRTVAEAWSALRAKNKTGELRNMYPGIEGWIKELQEGWRAKAEKLLERIATMEVGDDEHEEENRRTLLRHAIFGFERLRVRGNAEELEQALASGVEPLLRLLAGRDSLEASLYRDIVKNRLEVIDELQRLRDADQRERVLQKYLFDHLWLLDPAWERATGSEEMERRLRTNRVFRDDPATKATYGRIDIRYRTVAGKHVIVELKRASASPGIYELADQGAKYVDAMKAVLPPEDTERAHIEVVFVVGRCPQDSPQRIEDAMKSVAPGSRVLTYDLLVDRARAAYAEYLAGTQAADRIDQIFGTP